MGGRCRRVRVSSVVYCVRGTLMYIIGCISGIDIVYTILSNTFIQIIIVDILFIYIVIILRDMLRIRLVCECVSVCYIDRIYFLHGNMFGFAALECDRYFVEIYIMMVVVLNTPHYYTAICGQSAQYKI